MSNIDKDAEIASLRAQLDEAKARSIRPGYDQYCLADIAALVDEARRKAIEDAAQKVEQFYIAPKPTSRAAQFHERNVRAILAAEVRALLQNIMRGKPMMEGITPSCGCVFCDLDLERIKRAYDRKYVHPVKHRDGKSEWVLCTKDDE